MKTLDEQEFFSDLDMLPLIIVYSSDDPEVIPRCGHYVQILTLTF